MQVWHNLQKVSKQAKYIDQTPDMLERKEFDSKDYCTNATISSHYSNSARITSGKALYKQIIRTNVYKFNHGKSVLKQNPAILKLQILSCMFIALH